MKRLDYDFNKTKIAQLIIDAIPKDIVVLDINKSDSEYVKVYLQMPKNHPHTIATNNQEYVMEIPKIYASKLNLPQISEPSE